MAVLERWDEVAGERRPVMVPTAPTVVPITSAALTPASGWIDYGGNYAAPMVYRQGDVIFIEGLLKRESTTTWTAATAYNLTTVPVGFRATQAKLLLAVYTGSSSNAALAWARMTVNETGGVYAYSAVDVSWSVGGWISIDAVIRAVP